MRGQLHPLSRERDTSCVCRWTGVMSKNQSENTEVTVILIMLVLIDITSICQQRSQIIFNWMIIITVLINDNSYGENKKRFPWGIIWPQADNVSHIYETNHIWLKSWKCRFHKSYCELVNIYFQHMNHSSILILKSFVSQSPMYEKKEAINSGIEAGQIKKWHKHLHLWQSCAIWLCFTNLIHS